MVWTTEEQLVFLSSKLSDHESRKGNVGKLADFWDTLKTDWMERFGCEEFERKNKKGEPYGTSVRILYN